MTRILGLCAYLVALLASPCGASESARREVWLYYPTNLAVDQNIDQLDAVWTRAANAGYTHALLADSKFARLQDLPGHYFENVRRARAVAGRLKLTIIPAVFPVGYSNDLLFNDPNLAEGLPVKDAPFVVRGGEARLVPDPGVAFDEMALKDDNVSLAGATATVQSGKAGVARLAYKLKLPPFRCYHVSVQIKTDGYRGRPEIKALAGNRNLQWQDLGVKPTQDWTAHHVVFNSLDNAGVAVYFGDWSHPAAGALRWKDWKIEEVGPLNVLRRPGAPLTVAGEGGKAYTEGEDFEPIRDPKMGNVPYPGEYRAWHEPPAIKTRLPDGTRLRVSWYHPAIIYQGQVSACVAEPKAIELLADQAKRVREAFDAPGYMMSHDEFRTLGWDAACAGTRHTPGEMLADNARRCRDLLRPAAAYVWNDMFAPFHNAVEGPYYLVNGPWTGAWAGLDKDVVVVNWNYGRRDESLPFFAGRGHKQVIAGYYDGSHDTKKWLESADKVAGVIGVMYTTWRNDYSKMEAFGGEVGSRR